MELGAGDEAEDRFTELRAALGTFDGDSHSPLGRRALVVVGGVLSVAAVVLGVSWLRPVSSAGESPPPVVVPTSSPSATSAVEEPASDVRVWPDEPMEVDGTEIRSGGHRWSVGEDGDLVAIGDWDCDGTPTPAVLRPASGQLFVFGDWAPAEGAVSARPAATAPTDAVEFRAAGCGAAAVVVADGSTVTIEVGK